jgi:transcriptional regulator with XRE-family HTH domain
MSLSFVDRYPLGMPCSTTSAQGAMRDRVYHLLIRVGGTLGVLGTTSADSGTTPDHAFMTQAQTNSGVHVPESQTPSAALLELRRLSGLTWDQLARLFGITRRSLHFWASGKPLTLAHEERLQRLLATVRQLDRGSAHANRTLLLGVHADGCIPFDLLVAGQYERVLALLGPGHAPTRPHPLALAVDARAARAPYAPEDVAGALPDRVHTEVGQVRAPRVTRGRT